ncbi:YlzJ-like family protein [Bacillus sp. FJAT-45350]|uniref:YlzJ-like family protein n=1 Tax=Bacillus sp. FJAT-45350 TaxID=2011014 RepID=UPI000BB7830C|nr:YlzJ-like family protein [Bacillus sp. FJAT-45350]
MILYTTVPQELIYPEQEESFAKQQTIEIAGGLLVVEAVSESEYKVIRLISSDPMQYLNSSYSPGAVIPMKPQINM